MSDFQEQKEPPAPSEAPAGTDKPAGGHKERKEHHPEHKKKTAELEATLEKTRKDYEEMLETARRIKAEYENYRKRTEGQFFERVDSEKSGLLRDYLAVLDDVERALAHLTTESGLEEWRKGMDLVLARFRKLLEANGIAAIDPLNNAFDPSLHEALMMEEKEGLEKETVTEVFEKGYTLNDRILRHAKVRVAKPAEQSKSTEES